MSEKRVRAFHPPLFALHAPLTLYAANISLIPFSDALLPIAVCAMVGSALWAVLGLAMKDFSRAAAASSVVAYGFFFFGDWEEMLKDWLWLRELLDPRLTHKIILGLILFLVAWAASRKWRFSGGLTTFLNVVGVLIVVFSLYSIVQTNLTIRAELARTMARQQANGTSVTKDGHPDIFYVILDGYGREDALKRYYGFDNSPFLEALEARGFFVADKARPNYVQTELSLASSLNLDFVQNLMEALATPVENRAVLDGLIDRNRIAERLRRLGYSYQAVTTGFPALRFSSADMAYSRDFDQSLYFSALIDKTPMRPTEEGMQSMFRVRYESLMAGFENLASFTKPAAKPRFVVAHIFVPHPPFVIGPDLEYVKQRRMFGYWDGSHYMTQVGTRESYRQGYVEQLKGTNKLVLKTLDALLADSARDPIIILQGDHGPKMRLDQESLQKTDLGEVGGILAAYRAPEALRSQLRADITPVNAMRALVGFVTGETLGALPDKTFWSSWNEPAGFVDVTERLNVLEKTQVGSVESQKAANPSKP